MTATNHSLEIYTERIHTVIDYISAHLSDEISLDTLSTVACFSAFHFHRIFTAFTGETPRDYIERIRLEKAANQLCIVPARSVAEIAAKCGFSSVSTFSRAFKNHYKIPPSQFLEQHRHDFHSLNVPPQKRIAVQHINADSIQIEITQLPSFHVAYAQSLIGYVQGIPQAWRKIFNFAKMNNMLTDSVMCIGMPFDNPGVTPREKCRYRACITVPESIERKRGEIKTLNIEPASYAIYAFKGRRENITDAYALLYGVWLPQSGYIPDGKPLIEIYPQSLMADCSVEILEYKIALPIKLL
jgi:AraC family transcriptional regulator